MVVIYTNESNPAALKLVATAKLSKKLVELKIVPATDKSLPQPQHLPYIQLDENRVIFSSNAAAKYLLPPASKDEKLINKFLEIEAYDLSPKLALGLSGTAGSAKLKGLIDVTLKSLDDKLKETPLNGKSITVGDISIWATLYPLFSDTSLSKEYLEKYSNVVNWMTNIGKDDILQQSLKEYKVNPGSSSYQALLGGSKYSMPLGEGSTAQQAEQTSDVISPQELNAAKEAWSKGLDKLPQIKKETNPILPVPGEKNIMITSALPYVNNVPHLGNIIGCVLSSDVFARFSRLCNWNTLYLGGTDEYGTATETKALEENLTPQQICDKYFEIHNSIYRWFNIGFDYFGRTTHPEQKELTQKMFLRLRDNGFMHTQPVEQLLCEKCKRFLADRFVEGGCPHPGCNYEDARGDQCDKCGKLVTATELIKPRCKICSTAPVLRTSEQFFLDLPQLEPLVRHWLEKRLPGWTNNAQVITKSWMREGLKARCITRDLKWGVNVPLDGFRDKVFYVWFDAPIGYMSITARYTKQWEKWWRPDKTTDVTYYQFMAKDNVPFHSVMFPACLLGANDGYVTVSHIMATEYLNYEDGKFSKSRGVGVFGTDAQSTGIPSDVWRFYLLFVRPEGQDSSFSWADLATKNNSELLNNLGNFVNRALVFTEKFFNSVIPEMKPTAEDYTVLALCARDLKGYVNSLERAKLRDGIRYILSISKHGNQYMQSTQPWVLLKGTPEEKERAGTVIGLCCNISCLLANLMLPYMPDSSRKLRTQLAAPAEASILTPDNPEIIRFLQAGHKIGKPAPLFAKIEPAFVEEMRKKFGGSQQQQQQQSPPVDQKVKTESPVSNGIPIDGVADLEEAVQQQADKVRLLKTGGQPKTMWAPEVAILLDLKKKLEAAKKK